MSIEAIAKYYSADKTQTIIVDYRKLQSKLGLKSTFLGKEETEPPWWSGDISIYNTPWKNYSIKKGGKAKFQGT